MGAVRPELESLDTCRDGRLLVRCSVKPPGLTMTSSRPAASLPGFIAEEQVRRQEERRKAFAAMKSLTQQGRHREAADLWNELTEQDRVA